MFESTKLAKKEKQFLLRFTNEEYTWLKNEAKVNKMNMSNFIRYLIGLGVAATNKQIER